MESMSLMPTNKFMYLLECSVCLDPFTRPKVLPCQHTYCYACLLTLAPQGDAITCPQCRKRHTIPTDEGVQGFPDNLVINDLLGLQDEAKNEDAVRSEQPDAEDVLCRDCEKTTSVCSCDHCEQELCTTCLVKHAKFVGQIETILFELQDYMSSQRKLRQDQHHVREKLQELRVGKKEADIEFDKMLDDLKRRRQYFDEYFSMMETMYQDLLDAEDTDGISGSDGQHKATEDVQGASASTTSKKETPRTCSLDGLNSSLCESKTCTSLQSLKRRVCDMRTAAKLVFRGEDFKFVWEGLETGRLARFEVGKTVVEIAGQYGALGKKSEFLKPLAAECGTQTAETEPAGDEIKDAETGRADDVPSLKVGDEVRVKQAVRAPRHGWAGITHASVGTVISIDGEDLKIDFPNYKDWKGTSKEMELDPDSSRIKIGDQVRVKPLVRIPRHNWGAVTRTSVGTVTSIIEEDIKVDFPERKGWKGIMSEMELVKRAVTRQCVSDRDSS